MKINEEKMKINEEKMKKLILLLLLVSSLCFGETVGGSGSSNEWIFPGDVTIEGSLSLSGGFNVDELSLSNGTVGAPALYSILDPNTGLFWLGSDELGFSAGGVEAVRMSENSGVITIFLKGNTTITVDDPFLYFDPITALESEWWIGTNHDASGDDDDVWEIRQNATPGSNVRFSVNPSGDIDAAGDIFTSSGNIGESGNVIAGLTITTASNTFDLANGSASLNVAVGKSVNIDQNFTVSGTAITLNQSLSTTDVVNFNGIVIGELIITVPSGSITLTAADALTATNKIMRVAGTVSNVMLTSTPSILPGTDGQELIIQGTNDGATLTFQDESNLAGSGLALNGSVNMTLGIFDTITLMYIVGETKWVELSRSDN